MQLLPAVARWTNVFEKYVLSLLFFHIAYGKRAFVPALFSGTISSTTELASVMLNVLILFFGLFFGLNLLFNRPAVQDPQRWRDIVIPLVATFLLYAFTSLAPFLPDLLMRNRLPLELQRPAILAALVISLVGYAIALWSVTYLGRSLAVVVSVRRLVSGGPYRFVRHPMYLGYFFLVTGMAVASASLFALMLLATYVALGVYRARLEEETLCAFSEEYRRYAAQTGFLLPRLRISRG